MNGKHNCVEKRTDWSISMELDQEKQNQEAAERCRALAQRIVRELAPRSVQVLEDSGLLEKAFCKMNTAVVQSAPELLVVADPQWVSLPAVQAEKVLLVCAEYAGMADCAKQLAAQGFCRELAWKDHGKEQLTALFCRMDAPELPELTPAQELAGYIRARSAAALITPHALLLEEVENADELLAQMPADPQCTDIVTRAGAKDTYYYSNANMSDNYAMIAQLIEDKDLCVMFAEMVRFNARIYPSATPLKYFQRSPYGLAPEVIEQTWKAMQENPEYADIEELTNNQNERFLFSTKHLTRRYAKAISDVDDFCD